MKYSKNGIIAVSKSAFIGTKDSFQNKPQNSWVIHNGVDTELFYPLEKVEKMYTEDVLNGKTTDQTDSSDESTKVGVTD